VGGEEFLLVLPDTDGKRALEICERLRQCVAVYPWNTLAEGLSVTLSVGIACAPPYDADELTLRADAALYAAKLQGRNCVAMAAA
jgi:diguanylate cyclase